jgi:hypothetical protein
MGKFLIRLPQLCGNPTSSYQVAKQEMAKKIMNLAFKIYFFHVSKWGCTCHKILRHGADIFTTFLKEGTMRIFIAPSPLKIHLRLPVLSPRTFGPLASTLIITPPKATMAVMLGLSH